MPGETLLVLGGTGLAGRAVADVAASRPDWSVTVAARNATTLSTPGQRPLAMDLNDPASIDAGLRQLPGLSAVAFCALAAGAAGPDGRDPNVRILAHALAGLERAAAVPRRILLIGGGKSYGPHLGPYRTPAREADPRVMGPIFYDEQQDLLAAWCARHGSRWVVLRPDLIFGPSLGSPMNMLTSLAAFAAVSRKLHIGLRFPGSFAGWSSLVQATDAGLLGRAALWALTDPEAENDVFNVINGDQFRWKHLWSDLAGLFGMAVDEPQPMPLAAQMADKGPVWEKVIQEHGLVPTPWERIASWPFLDMLLNVPFDMVQSTIKIRQAGFADCIDTRDSLTEQIGRLRAMRLIP